MHKVTLLPAGKVIEVDGETNLLEALTQEGHYIKSSCGGHASCTDCVIKVTSGEDNVSSPEFEELQILGNVFHITKERLACQTKVSGEVSIDISAHDKANDEAKREKKNKNFALKKAKTKIRSRDEVKQIEAEREERRQERRSNDDEWKNHWEKDNSDRPKRLGGGKRPRLFRTDHIDPEAASEKMKAGDARRAAMAEREANKKPFKRYSDDDKKRFSKDSRGPRKGGFKKRSDVEKGSSFKPRGFKKKWGDDEKGPRFKKDGDNSKRKSFRNKKED